MMTTDYFFRKTGRARWIGFKGRHLAAALALGFTCTALGSAAFAGNAAADPDPDVEAGSYISLNLDQDIVAVGDSITGTSSIYEGDGDVDSDDPITATSTGSYTQTANGTVSFNIPTSTYGDITVTGTSADAGSTSKTATAVLVNAILTPVDNFSGRSQTAYGVGEGVDLSVTTMPAGNESKIGTLQWTASGDGTVFDEGEGSGEFTAGDVAGSANIVLSITDGKLKGKSYAKSRTIKAPTGATFVKNSTTVEHTQGLASAGFHADIYFTPTDVSFSKVQEEEEYTAAEENQGMKGPALVATGSLSSQNGYPHQSAGYVTAGPGNITLGSHIALDHVYTGTVSGAGPFAEDGDATWTIPCDYKVGDFGIVHSAYRTAIQHWHESKTDTSGNSTMSISKGGITVSANLKDPTSP